MRILKDGSISLNKKDKIRLLKQLSYKVQIKQLPFSILIDVMNLTKDGNKIGREYICYDTVLQVWNELGV